MAVYERLPGVRKVTDSNVTAAWKQTLLASTVKTKEQACCIPVLQPTSLRELIDAVCCGCNSRPGSPHS